MTDLEQIWLSGTRITGAGLARFQKLIHLKSLLVGETRVDNAGWPTSAACAASSRWGARNPRHGRRLVHLKELKRLQVLDLRNTRTTDVGLNHLTGSPTSRSCFSRHEGHRPGDGGSRALTRLTNLSLAKPT